MRRPRALSVVVMMILTVLAGLLAAPGSRAADPFPTKPVELIVPTPPGGGTDITARLIAEVAEPFLGQKVVIVNRPGGSGSVGISLLSRARPDGYTLAFVWNAPLTIVPHTLDVGYGLDDYTPITQSTGGTPLIFCAKPDFPARDGKEFLEHLKQHPDRYTYGNDGVGATVQLAGERVFRAVGVKLRPVPFGGAGETLKAFLGGHVDIYGGSIPPVVGHVKDGKMKCLLATAAERNPALPGTTSLGELGLADKASDLWRGVIGPKGLPADRLAVLEKAFRQAAQTPQFKEALVKRGEQGIGSTAAEFRKMIAAEHAAHGEIIEALGLKKK
jgi:tripartite-type tricarboxylate transporter receptor subunit TctC